MAELLIVVAIIGILVAIAIPVFTSQLNKARFATNVANARSAYACAMTQRLENNVIGAYFDMNNDHACTPAWSPEVGGGPVIQGDLTVTGNPYDWTLEEHPELGQRIYDANIAVAFETETTPITFEFKHS